jgi:hypothetical protein
MPINEKRRIRGHQKKSKSMIERLSSKKGTKKDASAGGGGATAKL